MGTKQQQQYRQLLDECLSAFNALPNKKIDDGNGSTTYALASKIEHAFAELDERGETANADPAPTVVVHMEGGLIHDVRASSPMRVCFLDEDTEGGDPDCIKVIGGDELYLIDAMLTDEDGVDAEHVAGVISQIDGADFC